MVSPVVSLYSGDDGGGTTGGTTCGLPSVVSPVLHPSSPCCLPMVCQSRDTTGCPPIVPLPVVPQYRDTIGDTTFCPPVLPPCGVPSVILLLSPHYRDTTGNTTCCPPVCGVPCCPPCVWCPLLSPQCVVSPCCPPLSVVSPGEGDNTKGDNTVGGTMR